MTSKGGHNDNREQSGGDDAGDGREDGYDSGTGEDDAGEVIATLLAQREDPEILQAIEEADREYLRKIDAENGEEDPREAYEEAEQDPGSPHPHPIGQDDHPGEGGSKGGAGKEGAAPPRRARAPRSARQGVGTRSGCEEEGQERFGECVARLSSLPSVTVGDGWIVVHGECQRALSMLSAVDHVITDPPYSERVHSMSRAGMRRTPLRDGNGHITNCAITRERDFGFDHLDPTLRRLVSFESARICQGWGLFFSDVESVHMWTSDLVDCGMDHCRVGAWVKVGGTPQFTGDRPGVGFEAIEIAHHKGRKRWNGGGKLGIWEHLTCIDRGADPGTAERVHTAQKPLPLMLDLVADFTDPDEVILDPFAGSGTTGVAALRLGRKVILIEKDPKYAAICVERLRAEESDSTLNARRAGQVPLWG